MDGIFARAIFQACEYDQAFERTINYLDPVEYGFEEYKGGLRPTLNKLQDANPGSDIIVEEVDELLRNEQNVPSDTEDLDEVDINALSDYLSPCDNTAIAMPDIVYVQSRDTMILKTYCPPCWRRLELRLLLGLA